MSPLRAPAGWLAGEWLIAHFSCPVFGANGIVEEVYGVLNWKHALPGCLRQLLLL